MLEECEWNNTTADKCRKFIRLSGTPPKTLNVQSETFRRALGRPWADSAKHRRLIHIRVL